MYLSVVISFLILLGVSLPLSQSLIGLGILLMLTALLSTFILSTMVGSWFGFILFLIYITGLLVLFSYMLAMSPNVYSPGFHFFKWLFAFVFLTFVVLGGSKTLLHPSSIVSSFQESVSNLYSKASMPMFWFMGIFLLVALIMAVTLCYKAPKPLRQFLSS